MTRYYSKPGVANKILDYTDRTDYKPIDNRLFDPADLRTPAVSLNGAG